MDSNFDEMNPDEAAIVDIVSKKGPGSQFDGNDDLKHLDRASNMRPKSRVSGEIGQELDQASAK